MITFKINDYPNTDDTVYLNDDDGRLACYFDGRYTIQVFYLIHGNNMRVSLWKTKL
jgi:hypothetical protein